MAAVIYPKQRVFIRKGMAVKEGGTVGVVVKQNHKFGVTKCTIQYKHDESEETTADFWYQTDDLEILSELKKGEQLKMFY